MALGPVSHPGAPVRPPASRDVTPAQRAFFQAALGQAAPLVAAETAAPSRPPRQPQTAAPMETPRAAYRPGSLLDIKI